MSHDDPAVARVRAELAGLPEVPMPPDVAARIRRTLNDPAADRTGAGSDRTGEPGPPDPARWTRGPFARPRRTDAPLVRTAGGSVAARGRRFRRGGAPLAAALLVGVAGLVLVDTATNSGPQPVGSVDDLLTAGSAAFGQDGAGELADPVRRRACLTAAGVAEPGAALVGGTPYVVDGTPGTLVVLGDRQVGRYRLVVVDGACRALAEATAGR